MRIKNQPRLHELSTSLSRTFSKTVRLIENPSEEAQERWIIDSSSDVLSEEEKALTRDVLALFASERRTAECVEALEKKIQLLERTNVELTVCNRVLTETASRDALTGLYNRTYLLDKIEAELNRALRFGAPMSVLMLDLDHFKQVNDRFGHVTGDRVLQRVGALLKESCRVYDVPGRYGGEEFCLVLPETTLESSVAVAERIRRRLEATTVSLPKGNVSITTSIGVVGLDADTDDDLYVPTALIERADRALYEAKDRGRNRVVPWANPPSLATSH